MKTFVVGDIHGGHKALLQCFERSGFDREKDTLISLGDICDGWPQVKEVFDDLMSLKNLIFILGNHDYWTLEWLERGDDQDIWISQGGKNTYKSFGGDHTKVDPKYLAFLKAARLYYLDDKNRLFVHGGIDPNQRNMDKQNPDTLLWDRDLCRSARTNHHRNKDYKYGDFEEIFVGHTSTGFFFRHDPIVTDPKKLCNIWMLDTGGGWEGKLTMMDVDTHEYFQSDFVNELYPDSKGRRG